MVLKFADGLHLGDFGPFRTISNHAENENCYENTIFLDEHGGIVWNDGFDDELDRLYEDDDEDESVPNW